MTGVVDLIDFVVAAVFVNHVLVCSLYDFMGADRRLKLACQVLKADSRLEKDMLKLRNETASSVYCCN